MRQIRKRRNENHEYQEKLSILIGDQVYRWLETVIRNRPDSFNYPKGISTGEEGGAFAVESFVEGNTEYYAPLPEELTDCIWDEPIGQVRRESSSKELVW